MPPATRHRTPTVVYITPDHPSSRPEDHRSEHERRTHPPEGMPRRRPLECAHRAIPPHTRTFVSSLYRCSRGLYNDVPGARPTPFPFPTYLPHPGTGPGISMLAELRLEWWLNWSPWGASVRGGEGESPVVAGVVTMVVVGAFLLAGNTRGPSGPDGDNSGRLPRRPAAVSPPR